MVNCDLGGSLFMAEGRKNFSAAVAEKYGFTGRAASGKYVLSGRRPEIIYYEPVSRKVKNGPNRT